MTDTRPHQITFIDIDEPILAMIAEDFSTKHVRYLRAEDGFTVAAMAEGRPVGFIGLFWRHLPEPLPGILECFVDIIEVGADFRRRGIAQKLLSIAEDRARERGAYQIRAWSSDDKTEAIPMWRAWFRPRTDGDLSGRRGSARFFRDQSAVGERI